MARVTGLGAVRLKRRRRASDPFSMKRTALRSLGWMAFTALVATSTATLGYRLGGRQGFLDGFEAGSVSTETTQAAFSAFALQALREGDAPRAMSILERSVDAGTVAYWSYLHSGDSPFDRTGVVATSHQVMHKVARYRASHPPVSEDVQVREAIGEALAYVNARP